MQLVKNLSIDVISSITNESNRRLIDYSNEHPKGKLSTYLYNRTTGKGFHSVVNTIDTLNERMNALIDAQAQRIPKLYQSIFDLNF